LKFGLVPATMPVRLVELINEEITYWSGKKWKK
jgi:hypothetical protein